MPAGPVDFWGADELEALLADPRNAGRLGQVLAAVTASGEAEVFPGEQAALRAFRDAFPAVPARNPRVLARLSGRAAGIVLAGGLVLSGAAAAAATGVLPGVAQQTAKDVLARVGASVPGPNGHAAVHPARNSGTSSKPVTSAAPSAAPQGSARAGGGSVVSDPVRSSAAAGVYKGAKVSGTASKAKSDAGQHCNSTSSSIRNTKTKTPTPPERTRGNSSSHKPETPGAGQIPQPRSPQSPGSRDERP